MTSVDEPSRGEHGFKLRPTTVPRVIAQDAEEKMNRSLQQQRKLLSNIIFPSNLPAPCHPNVKSFTHLIRDLEAAAKGEEIHGAVNDSPYKTFSKEDLQKLESNVTNDLITPRKEIEIIQSKCSVHLRRAEYFQRLANERKEEGADKKVVFEKLSMAKIFQMNYEYCIASVSCPQRVAAFNHCFCNYTPDVIKAVVQAGQHKYICGKERQAIERCCGQKASAVIRKILE